MTLLFNYLKIPGCFVGWNASFAKNWILNAENFRNELNCNKDLPVIRHKNYALQKPFETEFLTVIGNAKLRPSFVVCWVTQGSRPLCGPRHPILHSNIFFYVKLLATIISSWNSLKCILWYLLELSDPFIKNENSVLPISIEKNFTFVFWKWGRFF